MIAIFMPRWQLQPSASRALFMGDVSAGEQYAEITSTVIADSFKQFCIRRAFVRDTMLQQEQTFKEQVQDLHKLYEVQRVLMQKCKIRGPQSFTKATDHTAQSSSLSNQQVSSPCQAIKPAPGARLEDKELFPPPGAPVVSGRAIKHDKNTREPPRTNTRAKRKIDLEQLPEEEEETEDEVEESIGAAMRMDAFEVHKDYVVHDIEIAARSRQIWEGLQGQPTDGPFQHSVSNNNGIGSWQLRAVPRKSFGERTARDSGGWHHLPISSNSMHQPHTIFRPKAVAARADESGSCPQFACITREALERQQLLDYAREPPAGRRQPQKRIGLDMTQSAESGRTPVASAYVQADDHDSGSLLHPAPYSCFKKPPKAFLTNDGRKSKVELRSVEMNPDESSSHENPTITSRTNPCSDGKT